MRGLLNLQVFRPNEKLSIKLFFTSTILGLVILFLGTLNGPFSVFTVLASILTGFYGIFIYINKYTCNLYTRYLLFLLFYFVVVGISYGNINLSFRGGDFGWIFTQDIRYVMYFIIGSVFANKRYMPVFHEFMRYIGFSSIIATFFGLFFFNFDIQNINDRTGTWNFSYYCWWFSSACFSYWGYYAIIMKKEKILGYSVLLSYFILGVLFLKRSVLINMIVLLLIAIFFSNKNSFKFLGRIIIIMAIILFITFIVNNILHLQTIDAIFNLLYDRFNTIDDLSGIDRVEEWKEYFAEASFFQLIFGNGIGHYPFVKVFEWHIINALHIGIYNIIFKGGILYALFYIFLYKRIFHKLFKFHSLEKYELVCLGVALSALISLFFEGSWTYTIEPLCISAPIFYVALNKKYENKTYRKI